jgi:hypothetical protein
MMPRSATQWRPRSVAGWSPGRGSGRGGDAATARRAMRGGSHPATGSHLHLEGTAPLYEVGPTMTYLEVP